MPAPPLDGGVFENPLVSLTQIMLTNLGINRQTLCTELAHLSGYNSVLCEGLEDNSEVIFGIISA